MGFLPSAKRSGEMMNHILTTRVTEQQSHDAECLPFVDLGNIDLVDIDQERQCPDLAKGRCECKLTEYLREISE